MTKALMLARQEQYLRRRRRMKLHVAIVSTLAVVLMIVLAYFMSPNPKEFRVGGDFIIFTNPTPQVDIPTDKDWRGI